MPGIFHKERHPWRPKTGFRSVIKLRRLTDFGGFSEARGCPCSCFYPAQPPGGESQRPPRFAISCWNLFDFLYSTGFLEMIETLGAILEVEWNKPYWARVCRSHSWLGHKHDDEPCRCCENQVGVPFNSRLVLEICQTRLLFCFFQTGSKHPQ